MFIRWLRYIALVFLALFVMGGVVAGLAAALIYPKLPSINVLKDYRPKVPLRVYTSDGALIGEFGEERRSLIKIEDVPKKMVQAILAAEDDRFYVHGGVDYAGVLRAAIANLVARGAREGASTITMQVARNFFLTSEKTMTRKLSEVLLSLKIEHSLTKNQILELYINQIYLGQRAYGFAAAATVYFGKPLDKLSVAEMAVLAGLPKAPSAYNPVANLHRAILRQHYVLRRMRELKYITQGEYEAALAQHLVIRKALTPVDVNADYVAEMVRQLMYDRYQDAAYNTGIKVYTTLRKADQEAAFQALRQGVLDYDQRHGYRGPEAYIELPSNQDPEATIEDALQDRDVVNGLIPAVVLEANGKQVKAFAKGNGLVNIKGEGLQFAKRMLSPKANPKVRIRRGAIIRLEKQPNGGWEIVQIPQAESAFVSMDPKTGAILSLVGGFDFYRNKFNHVIQAWRQSGSSFKPFIYSAALEKGFTPASIINDAPIVIDAAQTGGKVWEPQDFEGTFEGPMRLRMALAESKNLVAIRVLQAIGTQYAQDYITRFGFDAAQHPPYLTMALGAGSVTPFQMVDAYGVFANGGYLVKPYFIDRIVDGQGKVLAESNPVVAGSPQAQRVIDPRNAFIMTSLLQEVVRRGTAAKAMQLGRQDLAGKTGTTNDQVDAWFCGFNKTVVGVAWIGFDKPHTLGGAETGAHAALPIWMSYMGKVLKGVPESTYDIPDGVVVDKINPDTGLRVGDNQDGIPEYFYQENQPSEQSAWGNTGSTSDEVNNELF